MSRRTYRRTDGTPARAAAHPRVMLADRLPWVALLVLAALALVLASAGPARAAGISATQAKVSVWPEYDDPRVLVINQADIDPNVQLPADVTFNIPKGAEIGMACEVDAAGSHACKPYQLVDKGDYQALTYKVEAQHKVFFEYYYDAFPAGTPNRSFAFTFRPGFPVKNLTLEVQEPLRSTGFTLDPALSQTTSDSQGLTYHLQDFPNVQVDKPLSVKVSYSKSDNNPSVAPKDSSSGSGAPAAGAAGGGRNNSALFIVLAVLGFATLLFGGYKIFRPAAATSASGRRNGRSEGGRSRGGRVTRAQGQGGGRRGGVARGPAEKAGDTKFCTECGAALRRQDRFCPECGEEQV